jgi:hypothetical protein
MNNSWQSFAKKCFSNLPRFRAVCLLMKLAPRLLASWLLAVGLIIPAVAKEPPAARVKEIAGWLAPAPEAIGPSITNRAAWEALAQDPAIAGVVKEAAVLARKPVPAQSDDLFLDYTRTGNRDRWQRVANNRRGLVRTYVLAECLENKGRFIPPLEQLIAALCEEKTWVYPAHDSGLRNFRGEDTTIDLGSSALGWELATAGQLLGEKLPPKTQQLIRTNLERRIFASYRGSVRETRGGNWWLTTQNNWNAVCLSGVTGAALATLESPEERAWFIAAAEDYIQNFLSGFTPDGYCSEGVGYWNYGFGHFVMLSETVRRCTGGRLDLLGDPRAARPALFGARTEILAGLYPSIADCSPGTRPSVPLMTFLTNRFDFKLPGGTEDLPLRASKSLSETLLYADVPAELPRIATGPELAELNERTWFPDGGVLICRPGPGNAIPFAACLKGGNNAEHHNHNDVGTFMVISGKTMVLCDPGAEVYTARTFSAKRYTSKVLSSFGHPVPVIAGKLQRTGATARGVALQSRFTPEQDTLRLDIASAYDAPELKRLEREFIFQRGQSPALTVIDTFAFSRPTTYETALITWGRWKRNSAQDLVVTDGHDAVRVQIDSGNLPFEVVSETLDEDVRTKAKPVRLGLRLKAPVTQGQFKLVITPTK